MYINAIVEAHNGTACSLHECHPSLWSLDLGVSDLQSSGPAPKPSHTDNFTASCSLRASSRSTLSVLRGVCPSSSLLTFACSLCFCSSVSVSVCLARRPCFPKSQGWWEGLALTPPHLRLRKIFGLGSRRGEPEGNQKQGFVDRGREGDGIRHLGISWTVGRD